MSDGHIRPAPVRPRLPGWHTAAALFWFEAFGAAGLSVVAFAPLFALHGTSPPESWTDGTVVGGVVALAGAGITALGGWLARPVEIRAAIFVALGTAGPRRSCWRRSPMSSCSFRLDSGWAGRA